MTLRATPTGLRDERGRFVKAPARLKRVGAAYYLDGRRVSRKRAGEYAARAVARRKRAGKRPEKRPIPKVLRDAARALGLKVTRAGSCFRVRQGGRYDVGDLEQMSALASRFDRLGRSLGLRRWFAAPRAWVAVEYPPGRGPSGEDTYEVEVERGFGFEPIGKYPPGTRLRAAVLSLGAKVLERGARAVAHDIEIVVCPGFETVARRQLKRRIPKKLMGAIERARRGRATESDRDALTREYMRTVARAKGRKSRKGRR